MNDNNFMSASEMITRVCKNLDPSFLRSANKTVNLWTKIVESIRSNSINGENIGNNIAAHSRVVDLQNGILLVEVDHPGWMQMIGTYKKYILTGFKMRAPELGVNSIVFRLAGTNVELAKVKTEIEQQKERKNLEAKFERDQKKVEALGLDGKKNDQNSEKKSSLPSELQKMFDDIKEDMLTNDK